MAGHARRPFIGTGSRSLAWEIVNRATARATAGTCIFWSYWGTLCSWSNSHRTVAQEWVSCKLTTIGEACGAVLRETLRSTIDWAMEQITGYVRSREYVMAHLRLE